MNNIYRGKEKISILTNPCKYVCIYTKNGKIAKFAKKAGKKGKHNIYYAPL